MERLIRLKLAHETASISQIKQIGLLKRGKQT